MRAIITLVLFFIFHMAVASELGVKVISLENGYDLRVKEIQFSRILPHAYYDQAMSSIPGVFPNSQIIAKRRLGQLGKVSSSFYSLVCYKKLKEFDEVTISGIVTNSKKAWAFDAVVNETDFVDTILLLFETISDVPFSKQM